VSTWLPLGGKEQGVLSNLALFFFVVSVPSGTADETAETLYSIGISGYLFLVPKMERLFFKNFLRLIKKNCYPC
jgi:hypothetical protein